VPRVVVVVEDAGAEAVRVAAELPRAARREPLPATMLTLPLSTTPQRSLPSAADSAGANRIRLVVA
jgi:hypothetical protein